MNTDSVSAKDDQELVDPWLAASIFVRKACVSSHTHVTLESLCTDMEGRNVTSFPTRLLEIRQWDAWPGGNEAKPTF